MTDQDWYTKALRNVAKHGRSDCVLSQHVGQDQPRRIDDLPGQLIIRVDQDGKTVVKSNEKPQQMGLFKGDRNEWKQE